MKKYQKNALKVAIFAAIVVVLYFILKKIGFSSIYVTFMIADKKFILLAFIAVLLGFLTWNLKWYFLVREVAPASFWKVLITLMAGSFVNTTTPGARVGGEPLRAYYLSKMYKKEKSKFFGTTLVDKAVNTLAFFVLGVLSMLFVVLFVKIDVMIKVALEAVLVIMALVVASGIVLRKKIRIRKRYKKYIKAVAGKVYYFPLFKAIRKRFLTYKGFERYLIKKTKNVIRVATKALKKKDMLRRDIALSFARWVFIYMGTYSLFMAIGYDISIVAVAVVVTLSMFIGSMSTMPGGIGFIETIMISLYLAFGISSGIAATVAVIDRIIFYFYSLLAGGICLAYLSIKYK